MSALATSEKRASPLELFFDLVFVFAITQVTGLLSDEPNASGLARGLLVLAALWWAWAAYAWLTNTIDHELPATRVAMVVAMASMLVAALATPGAFGDDGLLFGGAYLVVRVMHIVLYAQGAPELTVRQGILRLAPTSAAGAVAILLAGLLDSPWRELVWAVALVTDYAGPYVRGIEGLTLVPGHFAERFGLIVIIALGESIVAIGVGVQGAELGAREVVCAVLGVALAACLWWAYFDVAAESAEHRLRAAEGYSQLTMARDAYAYLHLPMIAGIVLVALAIKKTLGHVDEPLKVVPALALGGGFALYLLAHVAFRLRTAQAVAAPRIVAAAAACALVPLATTVDAVVALGAAAVVGAALIGWEAGAVGRAAARRAAA